ncbi:nucleoside monophosphate kinase [Candidatus Gottesmanbacteria bacterium]|nr:nucleoside monophosphate kinase [Candidatus Gottesmanbacteria bacterium]
MHIVFFGPEGSGKGTQAKLLADKLNLPLITFGDLVRNAAKDDKGMIGNSARKALTEGKYLPDSEAFVLWKNRLKDSQAEKGFIIDGFPRSIKQAEFLVNNVNKYGYNIDHFIYLMLSDEEAVKRLAKRKRKLFAGSKINHDDPERVRGRLAEYRKKEKEILDFFGRQDIVRKINGEKSIEEVHQDILNQIK